MSDGTMSNAAALNGWRKSSYSNDQAGSCLEVIDGYGGGVPVRDSKVGDGPAVVFSVSGWAAFVGAVRQAHAFTDCS
ncbi:DUF397 domain-containing protein [Streptomyces sp. CRN 30]|uniref:DUF397 domain-containing protein n=1 Tax=Streptomyces sp. CRN 30 TaxID=3075613 RepID=UPI002A7FEAA1|nr:DUF397 domain-containing protein [Streptomyces sp. CRN 30]